MVASSASAQSPSVASTDRGSSVGERLASATAPATATEPAVQRGSRWVTRLCSAAYSAERRHIIGEDNTPSGATRIALPLPAYGDGVPAWSHGTPDAIRRAARDSTGPAAHQAVASHQGGQTPAEFDRAPLPGVPQAQQQLAGELGIVAVLPKGEGRRGSARRRGRRAAHHARRPRRRRAAPPRPRSRVRPPGPGRAAHRRGDQEGRAQLQKTGTWHPAYGSRGGGNAIPLRCELPGARARLEETSVLPDALTRRRPDRDRPMSPARSLNAALLFARSAPGRGFSTTSLPFPSKPDRALRPVTDR